MVLTSFGNEEKIQQAIAAGASGYCLKDAPPQELVTAINAVAAGGTYLGRGITPKALTQISSTPSEEAKTGHPGSDEGIFAELTKRELDVLDKLAQGLGNKEIAEALFVSEKTVKSHVANVLHKLEVKTRTQAALLVSEYRANRRMAVE
jgi:DNA-binding NarL/FixJ family response regulator